MKKILILFFTILNSFCYSQNAKIDSILLLIKTDKADTSKLLHLNRLSREYENLGSYDSAMIYANSSLQLSRVILRESKNPVLTKATEGFIADSYNNIGFVYYDQSNYYEALKNHLISLKKYKDIGEKKGLAATYNNIGNVYFAQGNYPEALKNHFACLKIKETIGDMKGVSKSYNNIGNVYLEQNNYQEALKNYFSSLKIKKAINDQRGIANSYSNIGNVYYSQNNYPLALENYFAALKIREGLGDKAGIASSYNDIGGVYYSNNNYSESLKNLLMSLKIKEAIGNKSGIAGSYGNIGNLFKKQKKYKEAENYFLKAIELSKSIGYKEYLKNTYSELSQLYSERRNYKGAYENHKLYVLYRDSLDNEETRKKTIQTQMTFDFEKKEAVATAEHKKELENQNALSEEKSRKQKAVIGFVGLSLFLVLVFAGFIFRSLRITRKQKHIIEIQKNKVEEQKQEVEHQKQLVEEHQKDIIDSITYAKRLQQAILPSDLEIKKYLPDSFILYKPKDIVAGDFYWLYHSPEENIVFIAAADSTGHGVPGAMVSVVCSNALNRAVNEFNLIEPGNILDKTRELVLETFAKSGEEIKDGMDISLLSLKFESLKLKEVQWSGANNPLWYIRNNELIEIKPEKQSIGKTEKPMPFTTHTISSTFGSLAGTLFYLFTDGYADQFGGAKGKKYKYKQLQEKIIFSSNLSLNEQKESLVNAFDEWKGNLEQVDDVTLIGIKI